MALLTVQGLTRRFQGLVAVDSVDFVVQPGTVHGLIGPNGAGKTTLFNLVSGVLAPSAGSVRLGDQPLDGLAPYRRTALGLARTFQNIRIFSEMTVLENVMTGLHTRLTSTWGIVLRGPGFRAEERQAKAKARDLLPSSASRTPPTPAPATFPTATSAGSRSPGRSPASRASSSSTSPPPA